MCPATTIFRVCVNNSASTYTATTFNGAFLPMTSSFDWSDLTHMLTRKRASFLASLPMNINYFRRVSVEAPSAYTTAPQHSVVSGGLAWMVTCHDRITAQVPLNSPQNHALGPSYIMISGRLVAVGVYRAVQLLIS